MVTGNINPAIGDGTEDLQRVKKLLEGNPIQVTVSQDSTEGCMKIAGSMDNILQANAVLSSSLPADLKDYEEPFCNVVKIKMSMMEFSAVTFFLTKEPGFDQLSLQLSDDGYLMVETDDEKVEKKINEIYSKVKQLYSEELALTPTEMDSIFAVLSELQTEGEVFVYVIREESKIVLQGDYEPVSRAKHRIEIGTGKKKQARRNRRFDTGPAPEPRIQNENTNTPYSPVSNFNASSNDGTFSIESKFKTAEGIEVQVYVGSILNLNVDCIVNAANENLSHGAGVAYVISRAAGYDMDKEGREYLRKYGPIPVGECCSTTAGDLTRYSCVIHTVGPRWNDYNNKGQCRDVLRKSVRVCLEEASRKGLSSIGIPSISAGIKAILKMI